MSLRAYSLVVEFSSPKREAEVQVLVGPLKNFLISFSTKLVLGGSQITPGVFLNHVMTYRYQRDFPEVKTINYIRAVSLQNWRREEKAIDMLYTYDGEISECATSSIFLVKDKTIIMPGENVLGSVTAKVILELAGDKYKIEQRPIEESELKTADEIFIASTFKDIAPIVKIDNFEIGNGQVGEVTSDLMAKFKDYIANF